jgi:hypothetical protein
VTGSLVVFLLAERAPSEGPRPSAQSKIDQATRREDRVERAWNEHLEDC